MKTRDKRSLRIMAAVAALSLTVAACGDGEGADDDDVDVLGETTTTFASDTSTTVTGGATSDFEALEERVDALGDEIDATDNEQLEEGWGELEEKIDDFLDDADDAEVDAELMAELTTELQAFDTLVQQNAAEVGAEIQSAWNDLFTQLETALSTS